MPRLTFIACVHLGFTLGLVALCGCPSRRVPDPNSPIQPNSPTLAQSSESLSSKHSGDPIQAPDSNRAQRTDGSISNSDSIESQWTEILHRQSGLQWTYRNGRQADKCTILESLGGGLGVIDFNNDGRPDLCATGGGSFGQDGTIDGLPSALWMNLGDWKFSQHSVAAHLAPVSFYTHGVAVADFNQDGFSDVALTGYGGLMLWVNLGDGTFDEQARLVGLEHPWWSSSAAWGDVNEDQHLDLYVANYVDWSFSNHPQCRSVDGQRDICPPKSFKGLNDSLYLNSGTGTFQAADSLSGLVPEGKGLGVMMADFNGDHRLDIYVANDTTDNFLYINQGRGKFVEQGVLRGAALDDRGLPNGSMGVDCLDYNRDGRLDIWVCNYEDETFALYRNTGDAYFIHSSKATGLNSFGQRFVGFGTACADFDGDGDEDVVVANGHVIKYPQRSPRRQLPLFLNHEKGRFVRQTFSKDHYFGQEHEGRGLVTADFDGDGDLDLAVSHCDEPLALLRNDAQSPRQLLVRLVGRSSNRDCIGATLVLHTDKGQYMRTIKGGGSYLSTHQSVAHFGWSSNEEVNRLSVHWPSGQQTTQEMNTKQLIAGQRQLLLVEPGESLHP